MRLSSISYYVVVVFLYPAFILFANQQKWRWIVRHYKHVIKNGYWIVQLTFVAHSWTWYIFSCVIRFAIITSLMFCNHSGGKWNIRFTCTHCTWHHTSFVYTWRHTHGQVKQYRICKRFINEERMDIRKQKGNKRQCRLYTSLVSLTFSWRHFLSSFNLRLPHLFPHAPLPKRKKGRRRRRNVWFRRGRNGRKEKEGERESMHTYVQGQPDEKRKRKEKGER